MELTRKQEQLIMAVAKAFENLSEEYDNDEVLAELLIDNNDLFPMSLDDLASEWKSVARGERGVDEVEEVVDEPYYELSGDYFEAFVSQCNDSAVYLNTSTPVGEFIGAESHSNDGGDETFVGVFQDPEVDNCVVAMAFLVVSGEEDDEVEFGSFRPQVYDQVGIDFNKVLEDAKVVVNNSFKPYDLDHMGILFAK